MERKFKAMTFYMTRGRDENEGFIVRVYALVKDNMTWKEAKALRKWDKSVMLVPQIG